MWHSTATPAMHFHTRPMASAYFQQAKQHNDLSYGDKPWQTLDVFEPVTKDTQACPVLVFFYGGGWHDGNKERYHYIAKTFNQLGYVVVIPNYVLFPQGKFPDFIYDGAHCIQWIKEHISDYSGDHNKIVLAGHSAGAHLGALLSTDQRYLASVGCHKQDIKAFAGLAGPYDFTPWYSRYSEVFDSTTSQLNARVSRFVDGTEPPMLLAQAGTDLIVQEHTRAPLVRALKAARVPVNDVTYERMGHMGIVMALSSLMGANKPVINDVHRFFQQHL